MDLTILIKTFERPSAIRRLVDSIKKYYPSVPIVVVDDSLSPEHIEGTELLTLPFDSGLSAGRNAGIDMIRTKYFFTCDDDNIFTENTDLEKAIKILEESGVDLLGVKEEGSKYYGVFNTEVSTVRYLNETRGQVMTSHGLVNFYDFVSNLFIMKTDVAKQYRWDPSLKIGEHFAYFYEHRGNIKIGFTQFVTLVHDHVTTTYYDGFRDRSLDYVKKYMREHGLTTRIDLHGNIVEV